MVKLMKSKEAIHSTPTTSSLVLSLNKELDVNTTISNEAYKRRKLN
jgi:hypothetical protein